MPAPDSLERLIRDLKGFEDRKVVLNQLRKDIRKPLPAVRKAIRARAVATLPTGGGLNKWVAKVAITASVKVSSRTAQIAIRGGRNSQRKRTDTRAIDRGRVRAPSWGHRGRKAWHTTKVPAGFFTGPASEITAWRRAVVDAADTALDTIRRGK